jgi:hypothetical protein
MCERKWAWSKLDRVPKIMGPSAALGDAVHKQHERWLTNGTPYDLSTREGTIAMATMHLLPAPGVARVEQEVIYDWRAPSGSVYRLGGKLDGHWLEQPGPYLVILDHKTTGAIGFRKDTLEKLLAHPQAPIYSTWGFEHGDNGQPVQGSLINLRWNYVDVKPKRPLAYPSWHMVDPDQNYRAMLSVVEPVARRLVERVEQANSERRAGRPFAARHLPMTTSACAAFGGCQFRSRCQLTPSQEFTAHMAQQSNSFLARLGVVPGGASPAPSAPPPVVTPPAAGVPGYGAAINPPESAQPAPAPVEIVQTTIAPPEGPGAAETTAAPPKPKKSKGTAPAVVTVAPEVNNTVNNPTGSLLVAAIQGLCANPSITCFGPERVVEFAKEVAAAAGGAA